MKYPSPDWGHKQDVDVADKHHRQCLAEDLSQDTKVLGFALIRKRADGAYSVSYGGQPWVLFRALSGVSAGVISHDMVRDAVGGMGSYSRIEYKQDRNLLAREFAAIFDERDVVYSLDVIKYEEAQRRLAEAAPGGTGNDHTKPSTHGEEGKEEGRAQEAHGPESGPTEAGQAESGPAQGREEGPAQAGA